MALMELSHGKKQALYSRLIEKGLLENLTLDEVNRLGATKEDLLRDIETNYNNLLLLKNPTEEENRNQNLSIESTNRFPGNFRWNDENIPLVQNDYFVYNNKTDTQWDNLAATNSYPKAKDNLSCTVKIGDDDFTTYNNRTFADYFQHVQGSIRPKKNQTLDGWFDVGLKCIMFNNGIPYSSPNFQKSYYVWFIKGDGTDYPYLNQVAHTYPGQEVNFKYRYENLNSAKVKSASIIVVNGDTPGFQYGTAQEGFRAKLTQPNTYTNSIIKADLGLMESVGQRWHYQGFTIKTYSIFSKMPTEVNLEMRGDLVTLDITSLIETNLTWEFDQFDIQSSDTNVCTVEHDWVGNENDPRFILGPTYIRLIGNQDVQDQTVTIRISARPINTNYTEEFTFNVRVRQLYNRDTVLEVEPRNLITMVGKEVEYTVNTDAANYNVTTNNTSLIRLYKGKIAGLKPGSGILTFKAQASMSMPAVLNIPFTVNRYIPVPVIKTDILNMNLEVNTIKNLEFSTNCPRSNISVEIVNKDIVRNDEINWEDRVTNDDKLSTEFPTRYGSIPLRGITEGVTDIKIKAFITNGELNIEKKLTLVVNPAQTQETQDDNIDLSDEGVKQLTKTDAYLSFHHQQQGVFSYLRSRGKPELSPEELKEQYDNATANKIYIMPKVTEEDLRKYKKNEFTLALIEDMLQNDASISKDNNPNYIDYKESYSPLWGFVGNTAKDYNVWINKKNLEKFTTKLLDGKRVWIGDRGTMVNDIEYPFPGEKGFGVGPAPHDVALYYGMRPLKGCWDRNSDNYGNYLDPYGSVMVYIPRHYIRYVYTQKNQTKYLHHIEVWYPPVYSSVTTENIDYPTTTVKDKELRGKKGIITYKDNGYQELINSLIMPRCFINKNKLLPGIFVDKYQMSNTLFEYRKRKALNLSNKNFAKPYTKIRFKSNLNSYNNNRELNRDQYDYIWLQILSNKNRVPLYNIETHEYKKDRFSSNSSFNTIFTRSMINTLSLAHGSNSVLFNKVENCDWLNNEQSSPHMEDEFNPNINYTFSVSNHNGQKNGVAGLNNGNLELVIGAYYKIQATVEDRITNCSLDLQVASYQTDFTSLSQQYINAFVLNNSVLPSLDLNFSNIGDQLFPGEIINKGLYGRLDPSTKDMIIHPNYLPDGVVYRPKLKGKVLKPITFKNTFTPISNLNYMADNVVASNLHNGDTIEANLYNIGMWGYHLLGSDNETINPNENCQLDWNMQGINIGSNRLAFFNSEQDKPETNERNRELSYNMLPLFGGVLNYELNTQDEIKITDQHFLSMTWYRVGYDLSQFGLNRNIKLNIGTRLILLPDMDAIRLWFQNGGYEKEYFEEIEEFEDPISIESILGKDYQRRLRDYDPFTDPFEDFDDSNLPKYKSDQVKDDYTGPIEYPDDVPRQTTIVLNAILREPGMDEQE